MLNRVAHCQCHCHAELPDLCLDLSVVVDVEQVPLSLAPLDGRKPRVLLRWYLK